MNPGYAGRSNLPDNLKKLFRSIAMVKPDKELITQVTLYAQGFHNVEKLSRKVVTLFSMCQEQLSSQTHYDFGLRALKSVLSTAGNIKRGHVTAIDPKTDENTLEQEIIIESIESSLVPKLTSEDIPLLKWLVLCLLRML
jgi:dynein heavy chain 1